MYCWLRYFNCLWHNVSVGYFTGTTIHAIILQMQSSMGIRQYSVRSLSKRFDVVNMKEAARAAEDVLIENVAFQELSSSGGIHDKE